MNYFHHSKNPEKVDDMLDIVKYEGQDALSINGAVIGTEQELMEHLRKSEKCDVYEELFLNGGVSNE